MLPTSEKYSAQITMDRKISGRDNDDAARERGLTTIFTRDFFTRKLKTPFPRDCLTGEVMHAEPVSLRKKITLALVFLPLGLMAIFIVKPWTLEYLQGLNALGKTDPAQGSLGYARFFAGAFLPAILIVIYVVAGEIYRSGVAIRAGRWPIPGAKVRRKTSVIKGWCLYLRCLIVPLLLCATLVVSWIALIDVVSFFANNYLDFKMLTIPRKPA